MSSSRSGAEIIAYNLKRNTCRAVDLVMLPVAGDNLLAVVRAVVDSELLADPAEYRHGHVIYFDFVGQFMVILPLRLGTLINVIAIVLVTLRLANKLLKAGHGRCCSFSH